MSKLAVIVVIEVIIGVSLAGALLAILIPVLHRYALLTPGDLTSNVVVGIVIIAVTGAILLRPGSAINRRIRR
jgi:hypothetical protein